MRPLVARTLDAADQQRPTEGEIAKRFIKHNHHNNSSNNRWVARAKPALGH